MRARACVAVLQCVDMILLSQFLYYRFKNRQRPASDLRASVTMSLNGNETSPLLSDGLAPSASAGKKRAYSLFAMFSLSALVIVMLGDALLDEAGPHGKDTPLGATGRVLLFQQKNKYVNIIGTIIAWGSACFYLGSRVPQIYKNYKRGSTDGLALTMFMCAVMGNTFYAISIFLASYSWADYRVRLPYLIGSIGTLSFDFTIFSQFSYYKGKEPKIPTLA